MGAMPPLVKPETLLTNQGLLCIPDHAAFAGFTRSTIAEPVGRIGMAALWRVRRGSTPPCAPVLVLTGTTRPDALTAVVHAVIAAGARSVVYVGPARPASATIVPGARVVVDAATAADGTLVAAERDMSLKLVNALAKHGLRGTSATAGCWPGGACAVNDRLSAVVLGAAQANGRPGGALLVADPTWPWDAHSAPSPAPWAALYPLFAELLGREADFRDGSVCNAAAD